MVVEDINYKFDNYKNCNIFIFGESHHDWDSIVFIQKEIYKIKPKLLMHEFIDPYEWINKKEAVKRLKNDNVVSKDTNAEIPDVYEMIRDLNCLGYGYELPLKIVKQLKNNNDQFLLRENNAVSNLEKYKKIFNKICLVIGDTHLRSKSFEDLKTKSPIYEYAENNDDVILIRSKFKEVP